MTEFKLIQVATSGPVGVVVIHRPEKLNAINAEVLAELKRAIQALTSQAARAVVLTGAGEKAYVAGADIAAKAAMLGLLSESFRLAHLLIFETT